MSFQIMATDINRAELVEVQAESLQSRSVRVRTEFSLVSQGTEGSILRAATASFRKRWDNSLRIFHDDESGKNKFPKALGYSCVGKVVEIGDKVESISVGDTVWLDRPHSDEHMVEEAEAAFGICRPDVDPKRYVFRVLAKVALAGVHDANPFFGGTAVAVGLGVVGQITTQLLLRSGLSRVYAFDPSLVRRSLAEAAGATTFDPTEDCAALLKGDNKGYGVDCAIETSGSYAGLQSALRSVAVGGTVVTVSTYVGEKGSFNLGEEYHRNRIQIISSMSVNECSHRAYPIWDTRRTLVATKEILDRGIIEPENFISKIVTPADFAENASKYLSDTTEMATLIRY